jgi:hypothetical protein
MNNHEHKVKIIKEKAYKKDYASLLALLKGKVSFFNASRVLSLKCSLVELSVRPYTA